MKINLLFGIHCHQPVGNFDSVFNNAYLKAYLPFFKMLSRFSTVKCNVHISGPLWDWLYQTGKKELIDLLKGLNQKGQIEFLSGGYYEPVLPLIPYTDQINQIKLMNSFIEKEFSHKPKGLWPAERVWEPSLSKTINQAGLEFALLDDSHFLQAGLAKEEIKGFFTTEESGYPLKLFPINKYLRYKIPFSDIPETRAILQGLRDKFPGQLITIVDDGEKFGIWPGTYDWVYNKSWLENFFSMLEENSDWINTLTFDQAISDFSQEDIVYIPTSTYEEMTEWVLESARYQELINLKKQVPDSGFIQGGFFRNFLRKYKDINYMHKRMLDISKEVNKQFSYSKDKDIFSYLFKAQCNCAYWHGLFGGFYLPHLRNAVYQNLIETEKILDKTKAKQLHIEIKDFDFDSEEEIFLKNKDVIIEIAPHRGGNIEEISSKIFDFNFVNTLTRKKEIYHGKYSNYLESEEHKPQSIHQMSIKDKKEFQEYMIYDSYRKTCLIDHWIPKDIDINKLRQNKNLNSSVANHYTREILQDKDNIRVSMKNATPAYIIEKDIAFYENTPGFNSKYKLSVLEKSILKNDNFAIEFNLSTFGVISTYIKIDREKIYHLDDKAQLQKANTLEIIDTYKKSKLRFDFDNLGIILFPVYSVSLSEHKTEKIFQYTTCFFIKEINSQQQETDISFRILKEDDEG